MGVGGGRSWREWAMWGEWGQYCRSHSHSTWHLLTGMKKVFWVLFFINFTFNLRGDRSQWSARVNAFLSCESAPKSPLFKVLHTSSGFFLWSLYMLNPLESAKTTLNSESLPFLLWQHFLFSPDTCVLLISLSFFLSVYPPCIFIFEGGKVLSFLCSMICLIWFGRG